MASNMKEKSTYLLEEALPKLSFVGHQGGFDDARGTLFYDFVRLVDEIKPKMFIWENVKGVYTHDKGKLGK